MILLLCKAVAPVKSSLLPTSNLGSAFDVGALEWLKSWGEGPEDTLQALTLCCLAEQSGGLGTSISSKYRRQFGSWFSLRSHRVQAGEVAQP